MAVDKHTRIRADDARDEQGRPLYRRTSGGNLARNFKPSRREKERMFAFIAERDNWTCQICLTDVAYPWHLDHIIPYLYGGKFTADNLRLTCESCNCRRGVGG